MNKLKFLLILMLAFSFSQITTAATTIGNFCHQIGRF
jgi:hypothetical protein